MQISHSPAAATQTPSGGQLIDLADGYAKLRPAVTVPPDVYARLADASPRRLAETFLERYCAVSREPVEVGDVVFFLTASQAIGVVARQLAKSGVRRIGIPEPTYDNLPRLMRDAGLEPVPVPENDEAVLEAAATLDAIFLVLPNNPTGWAPSRRALTGLPDVAKRSGCRVVLDRTCRFHQDEQFGHLLDADFDWIGIEDTGKTWSTAGTKIAFVRARSARTLAAIDEDLSVQMKGVPALNLYLTAEAIAREDGVRRVRQVVERHRALLAASVGELGLHVVSRPLGVALLELPASRELGSTQLAEKLLAADVEVMPGRKFFWNSPELGESFIRVCLVRPTETFPAHAGALVEAIRTAS